MVKVQGAATAAATRSTNKNGAQAKKATPEEDPKQAQADKRTDRLRSKITLTHVESLDQSRDKHTEFNAKRTVDNLKVDIRGQSAKVMHLTELLYGHKDADLDFVDRVLSRLESLPPKEKPDVVVVSGLIYGGFQHREKNNRRNKTMTVNEQLSRANGFIERLQKMGMTVVYNISDNDQKIIEDYTYDAVKTMEGEVRKRGNDWPTSFASFDRVQQSRLWQKNYEFQWDIVFEYMLRSGRNLLTKEEIQEKSKEKGKPGTAIEEYLLLLDAHRRLEDGQRLTELQRKVFEVKNIPYSNRRPDKLIVTNDYNLELETKSKTTTLSGRHEFKQTATSMIKDPTKAPRMVLSQLAAAGKPVPNAMVIENQQRAMGVMQGDTFVMSTPGLTSYNFDTSSFARVSADKAERMAKTRGEVNIAGVQEVEFHDDGRISIHLMNDTLMNIAAKSKERHAAIFFSDWQTGNNTARPDLACKALDYALHSVLLKQPGMLFLNGDMIEGANYLHMPRKNANMGLVNIDEQELFLYNMMREILEKMPHEAKQNLQGVHITPGNHEWNSGEKFYGTTHSLFLKALFDEASDKQYRTTLHSNTLFRAGASQFKTHSAIAELAEHKVLAQHYIMHGGSSPPINQFASLLGSSAGSLMKEINVMGGGHWHHPQYQMSANKIGFLSGSLAGLGEYEWWKGMNPIMGTTIVHLGGDKPVEIEFLTPEFLYGYNCTGAFSDDNLGKQGYSTDKRFDPYKNGFGKIIVTTGDQHDKVPQNAIQKKLWDIVERIQWGSQEHNALSRST